MKQETSVSLNVQLVTEYISKIHKYFFNYLFNIFFKLIGSSYRQCQLNGTWSGENTWCDSELEKKLI